LGNAIAVTLPTRKLVIRNSALPLDALTGAIASDRQRLFQPLENSVR
jgi:hypothetical protein